MKPKIPERKASFDWWFEKQRKEYEDAEKKLNRELFLVFGGLAVVSVLFMVALVVN